MPSNLSILFIGDIIGRPGRQCLAHFIECYPATVVIANGENSAGGFGLTQSVYEQLCQSGVDVVTSGNHIWNKRDIYPLLAEGKYPILRPANYPPDALGRGDYVYRRDGVAVAVLNLAGRAFMPPSDCPLRAADRLLPALRQETPIVLVDFHAEATAEKSALAWYLDGRVSAVVGSHTHVQTADERILPGGTAFITDVGMVGPVDSVIGVKKELALERLLTGMPNRFTVASGKVVFNAVFMEIETETGKAVTIKRINEEYAEREG